MTVHINFNPEFFFKNITTLFTKHLPINYIIQPLHFECNYKHITAPKKGKEYVTPKLVLRKNMHLIAENPETQVFYDGISNCFYVVTDENNHIVIHEYTDQNKEYSILVRIHNEYKQNGTAYFCGF